MSKLRIGVIGAGGIAQHGHLPHYARHPEVELVAVSDVNGDRAKEVAARFGASQSFDSPEAMLAEAKLDAVSICTWTAGHAPLAIAALQKGMDVLVEKPMTSNTADAEAMVQAARENNRILMVGMCHRFRTETDLIRRVTVAGDLGDIYYGKAIVVSRRGAPGGWFINKELAGGGAVLDNGVHALDLAWYLMGLPEPISVSGQTFQGVAPYRTQFLTGYSAADRQNEEPFTVEDGGVALIRFAGGKALMLEAFWAINGQPEEGFNIKVHGTRGGAQLSPLQISHERHNILFDETPQVNAMADRFAVQMHHFIDCIRERRQPLVPGEQGLQVVRMLEAVYRSAESGREISL